MVAMALIHSTPKLVQSTNTTTVTANYVALLHTLHSSTQHCKFERSKWYQS